MSIATVVLGAAGYVGGELLRLIGAHPELRLAAAVSASNAGNRIADSFSHLAAAYGERRFHAAADWLEEIDRGGDVALFSAAPHCASAEIVQSALAAAGTRNLNVRVVDSSADFRYPDAAGFAAVYGNPHAAPALLEQFFCAVPEHASGTPGQHIGHPGCFATAALLAAVPLVDSGLTGGELFVTGITGSTGSGRSPQAGTHHPERHSNLYAYKPLAHRHTPEIHNLIAQATGHNASVHFVPHSGPFARGIYVTVQAKLERESSTESLQAAFRDYYRKAHFVNVVDGVPRLKEVVASNYCSIGVTVAGGTAVVNCAIDNLVKGAAGGAVQWMNRLWDLPETTGLTSAPPAWT